MQKKLKIYVAGPICNAGEVTDPEKIEKNVEQAMWVTLCLMSRGHAVFCPHLSVYLDRHRADHTGLPEFSHERWIEDDLLILEGFDALYYIGSSKGADAELEHAKMLGLWVFRDLMTVPSVGDTFPGQIVAPRSAKRCRDRVDQLVAKNDGLEEVVRTLRGEKVELTEKIERLESRGIEDLRHENAELRAENAEKRVIREDGVDVTGRRGPWSEKERGTVLYVERDTSAPFDQVIVNGKTYTPEVPEEDELLTEEEIAKIIEACQITGDFVGGFIGTVEQTLADPPMTAKEVHERAGVLVDGDRQKDYGHPWDNHGTTVEAFNVYMRRKYGEAWVDLDRYDVCTFNVCQKLAREMHTPKDDNGVDVIGYELNRAILRDHERNTEEG